MWAKAIDYGGKKVGLRMELLLSFYMAVPGLAAHHLTDDFLIQLIIA
jgi:hypothetical protein